MKKRPGPPPLKTSTAYLKRKKRVVPPPLPKSKNIKKEPPINEEEIQATPSKIPDASPSMIFFGESMDLILSIKKDSSERAYESAMTPVPMATPSMIVSEEAFFQDVSEISAIEERLTPVPMATPSMIVSEEVFYQSASENSKKDEGTPPPTQEISSKKTSRVPREDIDSIDDLLEGYLVDQDARRSKKD